MNGERQMLPVHTIRIRASSPMTEIPSGHVRGLGNERGLHGLILALRLGLPALHRIRAYRGALPLEMTHDAACGATSGLGHGWPASSVAPRQDLATS